MTLLANHVETMSPRSTTPHFKTRELAGILVIDVQDALEVVLGDKRGALLGLGVEQDEQLQNFGDTVIVDEGLCECCSSLWR